MLDQIKAVCEQTHAICEGSGSCTIEQVANLIMARTKIDDIVYKVYDVPRDNPIWGSFRRFHTLKVYDSAQTLVEVRYAAHLTENERRFVVGKELCHALETNTGTHTASDQAVSDLVAELAVFSTTERRGATLPIAAEKLAEMAAIELFAPTSYRKKLIANGEFERIGAPGMAAKLGLPEEYMGMAFSAGYMEVVESIVS